MNSRINSRFRQTFRLSAALFWLALIVGPASVGHTEERPQPSIVITAKRPAYTDFSSSIRDKIRDRTQITIWMTRISVGTDLGLKLSRPEKRYQLASNDTNKRG